MEKRFTLKLFVFIWQDQQAKITMPVVPNEAKQSEESKQKQERLISKSAFQSSSLANVPPVSSLRSNNERRDNNNVKYFDKFSAQKTSEVMSF